MADGLRRAQLRPRLHLVNTIENAARIGMGRDEMINCQMLSLGDSGCAGKVIKTKAVDDTKARKAATDNRGRHN